MQNQECCLSHRSEIFASIKFVDLYDILGFEENGLTIALFELDHESGVYIICFYPTRSKEGW